jgi:hypothetical protein
MYPQFTTHLTPEQITYIIFYLHTLRIFVVLFLHQDAYLNTKQLTIYLAHLLITNIVVMPMSSDAAAQDPARMVRFIDMLLVIATGALVLLVRQLSVELWKGRDCDGDNG